MEDGKVCIQGGATKDKEPESSVPSLPPELMCEVFKHMKGKDFLQVVNASQFFSELLRLQKAESLFLLVLPDLLSYLTGKEVLGLRRISKSFKKTVDVVLQYGPLIRDQEEAKDRDELVPLIKIPSSLDVFAMTTVRFTKWVEIQSFLEMFSGARNPFPGRAVHFAPTTANVTHEDLLEYEKFAKLLLKRFGHHIFRLTYKLPVFFTTRYDCHNIISILAQTESLQFLRLETGNHWLVPEPEDEEIVQRYVQLPQLPKLKILQLPCPNLDHFAVIRLIRAMYHEQVKVINVHGPSGIAFDDPFV